MPVPPDYMIYGDTPEDHELDEHGRTRETAEDECGGCGGKVLPTDEVCPHCGDA